MKVLIACIFTIFVMVGATCGQSVGKSSDNILNTNTKHLELTQLFSVHSDSLQLRNLWHSVDNMPIYNPQQPDAKILLWQPQKNYIYGMPNLLDKKDHQKIKLNKDDQKKNR